MSCSGVAIVLSGIHQVVPLTMKSARGDGQNSHKQRQYRIGSLSYFETFLEWYFHKSMVRDLKNLQINDSQR